MPPDNVAFGEEAQKVPNFISESLFNSTEYLSNVQEAIYNDLDY